MCAARYVRLAKGAGGGTNRGPPPPPPSAPVMHSVYTYEVTEET